MAEETKPNFSIIKLIPLTVLVALISQTSILTYYNYFNFSPVTYFDLDEIIFANSKDFVAITILVITYFQVIQVGILPLLDEKIVAHNPSPRGRNKRRNDFVIFLYTLTFVLFFAFIWITFYSKIKIEGMTPYVGMIWIIIIFLNLANFRMFHLLTRLRNHRSRQLRKYYPYIDPNVLTIVLSLFVYVVIFGDSRAKSIILKNPYKGTELTLENETIKCTSKVIFIGKSQKYYFIYNTPDKSVRVVKRDDIKKEVIKIDPNVNFFYRF